MKKTLCLYFMVLIAGFIVTGCAVSPGPFAGGNYQQITIDPQKKVTQVTVLRLAPESQQEMIQKQGTVVIGKSTFHIDSDNIDTNTLEAQAKAQAKMVNANVVMLSRAYTGDKTKTKTVEEKSDFQKAAEEIPVGLGVNQGSSNSSSSTSTTYTSTGSSTSETEKSSSFGLVGGATIGELTALIPGNVVSKKVDYKVEVYEIHAIFLCSPIYPGLN
jgi:hypothetical protein